MRLIFNILIALTCIICTDMTRSDVSGVMTTTETYTTDMMTTQSPSKETPAIYGYVGALVAVLFYGSCLVPVKKFETGDGVFFQWIVCSGIMLAGLVVQLIRDQPPFFPLVMIGGVVWTLGNICVVPIVKTIGLGLGFSIWAMVCLLSGWATGRFGFFGIIPSVPDNKLMNYAGVILCMISAVIFSMVRNEVSPASDDETVLIAEERSMSTEEYSQLLQNPTAKRQADVAAIPDQSFFDRISPGPARVLGLFLCIFSGLLYGQMFTAATYIQDHPDKFLGASQNGLDYVFSAMCGVYITSTSLFVIYILMTGNKPSVYPSAILPGIVSGLMWGVATSCWFVANRVLSIPVAFPIISAGPPIVASLWGVLLFKEIKGKKNLMILFSGFGVSITGAVLCGLSKS